ncbi:holin-associated N-acetylmuramidase [Paracoccus sp. p3-h83]|uniref:holin-associated N-acetylmuramidase n=1 Tax=Paracoccus sp. p3-h83 TaxID=3342805 RepID=UPI0035B78096
MTVMTRQPPRPAGAVSVDDLAREIVRREGGFVDDPDDPGGITNHGVTLLTLRRLGIDVTGDGHVDATDLRNLTADRAAAIFVDHYFRAPGLDRLPAALQPQLFDMYVNSGSNAIRVLQRMLNAMGHDLLVDGQIGPLTRRAAEAAARAAPVHLADAYAIARRDYYYALGDARPASRKYCRRRNGGKGGWITRAETFLSPRFHLTEAQHRARIAHWSRA